MEIVIVVVVVVLCVAVSWGFSLRRRMDKHAQEESDPELRQAVHRRAAADGPWSRLQPRILRLR